MKSFIANGLLALSFLCPCGLSFAAPEPAPAAPEPTLTTPSPKSPPPETAPATATKTDTLFTDPVVAKGKGFEVKQSRVDEAFILYKANVAAQGREIPDEQRPKIQADLLDRLVITEVLLQRATDADKAKGKEGSEKYITDIKKQLGSDEALNNEIKATGMTMDQFRARSLEQNICEAVINREVRDPNAVTETAVRKFYEENPTRFEMKEQVHVSHILISTIDPATHQPYAPEQKKEKEKLAKEIKARADKGEDFPKLVKEFSQDPGSKDNAGEYTFAKDQGMATAFEAAAFSLKTNQISDLVETQFGYHIIKLLNKIPPGKAEFAKVAPRLKEYLEDAQMKRLLPPYFEKIKKEDNVEIVGAKAKS